MVNAHDTAPVADTYAGSDHIVQLARLALTGRDEDITTYLRRLARTYRSNDPQLAEQLIDLLRRTPTRSTPLRDRGITSDTPVDLDSRSPLVKQEWPINLLVEPVFDEDIAATLQQIIDERRNAERLLRAGLNPTRAALLVGPPGVGKTLATRWMSRELGLPLIALDLSTVMSSFLGKTGGNLRRVLDYAKKSPCILLLDELDAIAKRRDDQVEVGELKRLVTVLLQEIDNWPTSGLLLAATNHSDLLDPAVWRRFDSIIHFPLPHSGLLRSSIGHLLSNADVSESLIDTLAEVLSGCSFSEAEREVNLARRASIVKDVDVSVALLDVVAKRTALLNFDEKRRLAVKLVTEGVLSQRKASSLLRVSRDVIRDTTKLSGTSPGRQADKEERDGRA